MMPKPPNGKMGSKYVFRLANKTTEIALGYETITKEDMIYLGVARTSDGEVLPTVANQAIKEMLDENAQKTSLVKLSTARSFSNKDIYESLERLLKLDTTEVNTFELIAMEGYSFQVFNMVKRVTSMEDVIIEKMQDEENAEEAMERSIESAYEQQHADGSSSYILN